MPDVVVTEGGVPWGKGWANTCGGMSFSGLAS